jgi:hypothetical protein
MALNGPNLNLGVLDRFSNNYNKMVAKNGSVLGWPVLAEIDHLKSRLINFADVNWSE